MSFKRVLLGIFIFLFFYISFLSSLASPLFAQSSTSTSTSTSNSTSSGIGDYCGQDPNCEYDVYDPWKKAHDDWANCTSNCGPEPVYNPQCQGAGCEGDGSSNGSTTSSTSSTSSAGGGGPTNTPVPTNTPTPTPTPIPLSWIKIHNGSFTSKTSLDNSIPPSVSSCDAADDGTRYFINGTAGVASANNINLGTAPVSTNDWKATGYTKQAVLSTSTFVEYLKARKTYQTITDLSSITADGLYVWSGAFPDLTSVPAQFNSYNVVLIVPGAVTIDMANFNPTKSIALLAQTLTFTPTTLRATGIFVADTVDTSTTANAGLTITGNLIASTTLTHDREYAAPGCPTLFIDFKASPYMDLLPYLSVAKYEWRQLQ